MNINISQLLTDQIFCQCTIFEDEQDSLGHLVVTLTSEAKNKPMAAKITQDYLASSSVFARFFFNDILSTTTNYERKSPSNLLELHSKNN